MIAVEQRGDEIPSWDLEIRMIRILMSQKKNAYFLSYFWRRLGHNCDVIRR